jgi:cysteine desulfurase
MSATPREIYADHAATTAPAPEVIAAMAPFQAAAFGNPSSVHRRGEAARDAVDEARGRVAVLIAAMPEEIVFTATGSEANNLALKGRWRRGPAARRIVVSAIEHLSVLETPRDRRRRVRVTVVPVGSDGGTTRPPGRVLGPDVALVR